MELAMEISEFCIVTGVHAQNFPNSVFGIMLTKVQAFNFENQLTQKYIDCQNNDKRFFRENPNHKIVGLNK